MSAKNLKAIISFILAVLLFVGGIILGYGTATNWKFQKAEKLSATNTESYTDGATISDGISNGITLMSAVVPLSDSSYVGAYILTASYSPKPVLVDPTALAVDYSCEWENADSEWAIGKDVSEYVTLSNALLNVTQCRVECLQAFGEAIIVTATCRADNSLYAQCKFDFRQKVTGVEFGESTINLTSDSYFKDISYNVTLSDTYTLPIEVSSIKTCFEYRLIDWYTLLDDAGSNYGITMTGHVKNSIENKYSYFYSDDGAFTAFADGNLTGNISVDCSYKSVIDNYILDYKSGISEDEKQSDRNALLTFLNEYIQHDSIPVVFRAVVAVTLDNGAVSYFEKDIQIDTDSLPDNTNIVIDSSSAEF